MCVDQVKENILENGVVRKGIRWTINEGEIEHRNCDLLTKWEFVVFTAILSSKIKLAKKKEKNRIF